MYLLVDVHDRARKIYHTEANCQLALDELLPAEFHSIAVLFDGSLLEEWYPKVGEYA